MIATQMDTPSSSHVPRNEYSMLLQHETAPKRKKFQIPNKNGCKFKHPSSNSTKASQFNNCHFEPLPHRLDNRLTFSQFIDDNKGRVVGVLNDVVHLPHLFKGPL